jgi:hypothetical protein
MGLIAASINPLGAPADGEAFALGDGVFELLTDGVLEEPLGLMAVVESPDTWPTMTLVALPKGGTNANFYGPMNDYRDVFATSYDTIWQLSELLWEYPGLEPYLPIGELGGVVGVVRDRESGQPVAGASVYADGFSQQGIVVYPDFESWSVWGETTGPEGLFVILGSAVGEEYRAASASGTSEAKLAVSTKGVVMALPFEL